MDSISSLEYRIALANQIGRTTDENGIGYGDQIEVSVELDGVLLSSRTLTPITWSQPLADHEITLETTWSLDQSTTNADENDVYQLVFVGRGWQQRIGDTLVANELGNGTLQLHEYTNEGTLLIDLLLSSIWRNETTVDGVLTDQEFEMRGNGTVSALSTVDGDLYANITVLDALVNRSLHQGSVSEHFLLEGYGGLAMHAEEENATTDMQGTISLFLLEFRDVDGERIQDHQEFVADAELDMVDGDERIHLEVDEFRSVHSWDYGLRTAQHDLIRGHGTFDIGDDSDNQSTTINGTIYSFVQESRDGITIEDYMHVDGTISGDAQGTWGILRQIEDTGIAVNSTGGQFEVNVIHQQVWFNLTGAGGIWLEDIGIGAYHNQTWDYQTLPIDWENRTIRYAWETTGVDASSGEEYPPDSPLQFDLEPPESESAMGDVNISRETGLVPEQLMPGDRIVLDDGELYTMTIEATQTGEIVKDGHVLPVTFFTGADPGIFPVGTMSGAIINQGILSGLVAEVSRSLILDIGDADVIFYENQTLERVLSPDIVTAAENTPPAILSVAFREGVDPDWNVRSVSVTITLDEEMVPDLVLNDVGLAGDLVIHDDVWTIPVSWPGATHGELSAVVSVVDSFSTTGETWLLAIENQAPDLVSASFSAIQAARNDTLSANVAAYDANGVAQVWIDMRLEGGQLHELAEDATDGIWRGEFVVPMAARPGQLSIPIRMQDDDGALTMVNGPSIIVTNEGPTLADASLDPDVIVAPPVGEMSLESYVLSVRAGDADGLSTVQVKLLELLPGTEGLNWMLMYDDGSHGDAVPGDGIYSMSFQARHMAAGSVPVGIRAIDVYGQTTVISHSVSIEEGGANIGSDPSGSLIDMLSEPMVLGGLILVLILGAVGAAVMLRRKSGNFGSFGED